MATSTNFQLVTNKKGKRSRRKPFCVPSYQTERKSTDSFDLTTFKKRLNDLIQELLKSSFFKESYENIIDALSEIIKSKTECRKRNQASDLSQEDGDIVLTGGEVKISDVTEERERKDGVLLLSYGLGRVSSCPIAQHQLAFFLALRKELNDPPTHVYDPLFSDEEVMALEQLGCHVLKQNEEGKRICLAPTIAFLPHCGKALYNNLIWANLASHQHFGIHNLLLVGNSFSLLHERVPSRVLKRTGTYILKMLPYTVEKLLPLNFEEDDVFNDMSIHTFPRSKFAATSSEFWNDLAEPQYENDDAEIIKKDDDGKKTSRQLMI